MGAARPSLAACLLLITLLAVCVAGLRNAREQSQLIKPAVDPSSSSAADCDDLNTYFFSVDDAVAKVVGAGRPGTTRLTLQLRKGQVSPRMPVVTASLSGVVHNVAKTWTFLKSFARLTKLVEGVNQKTGYKPHLYPVPSLGLGLASALTTPPAAATVDSVVQHAVAAGQKWTHPAPTNVLLLPTGHSVGAVADIMSVEMSEVTGSAPTVTLTLDVVHKPRFISELQEHDTQSLDESAHYHYLLPAGVTLDAAKFLTLLETTNGAVAGLNIFAKGDTPQTCASNEAECRATDPQPCERAFWCIPKVERCQRIGPPLSNETACFDTSIPNCDTLCNGVDLSCPCETPPPACTTGEVCRPAAGHCDIPEVCKNGVCPADKLKHKGARCPWYPKSYDGHGPYSVDVSSMQASKVTAEEAAERLASAPSYMREWPSCEGTCIDGVCALRWDHPVCCGIHRATHYDVDASAASAGKGHWEGPEWYCWD